MPETTTNLQLPLILPSQAQKHVTHNEALLRLDALVQLGVVAADLTAPPASPAEGERYIVAAAATGGWAGHEGEIAAYAQNGWSFYAPAAGWQAYVQADGQQLLYDGSGWQAVGGDLQNIAGVGINTSSDATNRLAVASDATLLSHAGGSHQLKINRAAASDTGALLFQNDYSGEVEMGMLGGSEFSIKTSTDGVSFDTALTIDPQTRITKAHAFGSLDVPVNSGAVALVPTPSAGGFAFITMTHPIYPQGPHSGIFVYDTGASLWMQAVFTSNAMTSQGVQTLSGTSGPAGNTNVAVTSGHLQIENRHTTNATYSVTFVGG